MDGVGEGNGDTLKWYEMIKKYPWKEKQKVIYVHFS